MWKISIFICLMLVISGIPKFIAAPCFPLWYRYYLYDGEDYCGCIDFVSDFMYNETDDVYLTIRVYPIGTLTINSFTIKIGDYEETLLKDAKIEEKYVKTISNRF